MTSVEMLRMDGRKKMFSGDAVTGFNQKGLVHLEQPSFCPNVCDFKIKNKNVES